MHVVLFAVLREDRGAEQRFHSTYMSQNDELDGQIKMILHSSMIGKVSANYALLK